MTITASSLLALRHTTPDGTLLDLLDLRRVLQPPCSVTTARLMAHWSCSQATVSRRLDRLRRAGLLEFTGRPGGRGYHVQRLGITQLQSTLTTAMMHNHLILDVAHHPMLRCIYCGAQEVITLPMPITQLVAVEKRWRLLHGRCRPGRPQQAIPKR